MSPGRRRRALPHRRDAARRSRIKLLVGEGRECRTAERRISPSIRRTRVYEDGWLVRLREGAMRKTVNQKAWFFVLPVVALVAFNALIPLMTVVNFSVQETFGDNVFFWAGVHLVRERAAIDPASTRSGASCCSPASSC
jgi:hypothetical protein